MKSAAGEKVQRIPFEVLLDQQTIADRIGELGEQITDDYKDKSLVVVGVLKGCIMFLADLIRQMNLSVELEFVSAASYRRGIKQEEDVVFGGPFSIPLKDRHVLVVEGVVDTGRTVSVLLKHIRGMEPASAEVATLLDKPGSHRSDLNIKYSGFKIGNEFVIGFGLDNTQRYRNLPYIGRVIEP